MSCCVCLSDQYQPFLDKNDYQIVQCQACGFLYVYPRPGREELDAFYQNPNYFQGGGAYGYAAYCAERKEIERQATERLALIERLMARGRLLDVGCAAGYFLHVAKARGWQVDGVEISRAVAPSAEQLLGQRIHPRLESLNAQPGSFDAVTLWEYIEHVLDPRDELLRLHRMLKPGGVLALSTPNTGQLHVRRHPGDWREFKPPEHLSFFTAETLTALLRACGFEVSAIKPIAPDMRPSESTQRLIDRLRLNLGDRHTRSTPFWWVYSITRRVLLAPTKLYHRLALTPLDYGQGIEAYARKDFQRTRINTDEHRS